MAIGATSESVFNYDPLVLSRPILLWLIAFLGFSLVGGAWAVASPYDGAPDEREHIVRAAGVMKGQWDPPRGDYAATAGVQTVPHSLTRSSCFGLQSSRAANCPPGPT